MSQTSLSSTMERNYPESFSLIEAIKDPLISDNVEKFYVPQAITEGSMFIKKDESIAITSEGPKRIRFIYLAPNGKNITSPDASYIQVVPGCKGFLARLSISRSNYTAANLSLDYFIDISKIKYTVDSVMTGENGEIILKDNLRFQNIDFNEYSRVELDINLKDFMKHKEDLFEMYFK